MLFKWRVCLAQSVHMFLLLLLVLTTARTIFADETHEAASQNGEEEQEEEPPADAILFPFLALTMGILLFWILSRFAPWFPYTAMCFLLGTIMGIGATSWEQENLLHESIVTWWINIDSEVLLLAFLPGLVYKDASSLNVHLFQVACGQCLLFAFPMVLGGTALTAMVCYYAFPYDWSFNLCMTVGSILMSATDPVAVAALLDQVGAPPRLKIHIAGESLLNDGSAIVFFTIFSRLFLYELGKPGLGEAIDGPAGVALFFRMSLGGACIGVFFAVGLLGVTNLLGRRLNREENVVEVASTVAMAYLCYFTAEVAWGASGVIATVVMGVTSNAFGHALINDFKLYEDFWSLAEYMLNTVLFALGGLVWGSVIANYDKENPDREFTGRDWGYLFVLYPLLMVIRFVLFAGFYPIYSRIGLKSSWQEMVFQSYGGLRGAIGIALAIFLDNVVRKATRESGITTQYEEQTNKVFGFVGGIAFLTLVINATLAGPLLKQLRLADTTAIREQILHSFRQHWRLSMVDDMVRLLSQSRFHKISFAVVKHHVPILADLTKAELEDAAQRYSNSAENDNDSGPPNLECVLPFLNGKDSKEDKSTDDGASNDKAKSGHTRVHGGPQAPSSQSALNARRASMTQLSGLPVQEIRRLFLEVVRSGYEHQIRNGELGNREFVAFSLLQSLEFAMDCVKKEALNDWYFVNVLDVPFVDRVRNSRFAKLWQWIVAVIGRPQANVGVAYAAMRIRIEQALSFMQSHRLAQRLLKSEFGNDSGFSEAEAQVFEESNAELKKAYQVLEDYELADVEAVVSHKLCTIVLINAASYVDKLVQDGFLKQQEAEEYLEEVQSRLHKITSCDIRDHGESNMVPSSLVKTDKQSA